MGKTIVFSWKIDNTKYGYLCGPESDNNEPMICDRITSHELMQAISGKVSKWDKLTYNSKLNALKALIGDYTHGFTITGTTDDYWYENGEDKNYIVLTGKDGSNSDKYSKHLDKDTLDEIKRYIDLQFKSTKDSLKEDINVFTAKTSTKIERVNEELGSKIEFAEKQLEAKNELLSNKLEAASTAITTATKIFDLESANITVEKLNKAIEDSAETKLWKDSAEEKINNHDEIVEFCKNSVEDTSVMVGNLGDRLEDYKSNTYNKISEVENQVEFVNARVSNIINASIAIQTASDVQSETEHIFDRGIDNGYVSETETIDNGDGTFDVNTTIGDETFNIKVFGYGKKLRPNGNEGVNGLILANNGIKYSDKSGSFISIINGNIKLSNSNGSGRIEIKDDGVYINGVKQ